MLVDIVNEQNKIGHDVTVMVLNRHVDPEIRERLYSAVKWYEMGRKRRGNNPLPVLQMLASIRFQIKPDVIHAHDHTLGKLIKRFLSIPVVLTIHGPGLETEPMEHFNKLFSISKSVKQDVLKRGGPDSQVLYNGIDTSQIRFREHFKTGKYFRIVHVKRLNHERKGQDLLIEAADTLVHKKGKSHYRFDLIGDGESREFLEKMIANKKLEKHVILRGKMNRDQIYGVLSTYDLFVHPSRYEGFGLTVTEAIAAKVPVVASNIEGPAEILQNGKYGLLFDNNEVDGLVNQIQIAEEMYVTGDIEAFVENAYQHCREYFDIQTTAKKYAESYLV